MNINIWKGALWLWSKNMGKHSTIFNRVTKETLITVEYTD